MSSEKPVSPPRTRLPPQHPAPPSPPSTPRALVLTTGEQETITHVGCNRFGFDSTVDIETLRSLYLVSSCTMGFVGYSVGRWTDFFRVLAL